HMTDHKENITNKDIIIARITQTIPEEPKLVQKIIRQIKNARRKPRSRLNINEKQLRVHLAEMIKKWERDQVSRLVNRFLAEMKTSWQRGENVAFRGIFSTQVYRTPARKVNNPQTGQPITVQAKNRLKVRISPQLKKEINKK
ncbi:8987_t:CDS:1, partial [Cetraspora pellucida]